MLVLSHPRSGLAHLAAEDARDENSFQVMRFDVISYVARRASLSTALALVGLVHLGPVEHHPLALLHHQVDLLVQPVEQLSLRGSLLVQRFGLKIHLFNFGGDFELFHLYQRKRTRHILVLYWLEVAYFPLLLDETFVCFRILGDVAPARKFLYVTRQTFHTEFVGNCKKCPDIALLYVCLPCVEKINYS